MRRRRGARRNPTGTQWALIGGGVAITGIVAYLIYKSSSSTTPQPAPAQVTTAPSPTPALTPSEAAWQAQAARAASEAAQRASEAASARANIPSVPAHLLIHPAATQGPNPSIPIKYSQKFANGTTIALVVGDTVQLLPPGSLTDPSWFWQFQIPDASIVQPFGLTVVNGTIMHGEGDYAAIHPGRVTVTCFQTNTAGATMGPPGTMTIAVSANISPILQG